MRHKLAITANYKMSFPKNKNIIKQQEKNILVNEHLLPLMLQQQKIDCCANSNQQAIDAWKGLRRAFRDRVSLRLARLGLGFRKGVSG